MLKGINFWIKVAFVHVSIKPLLKVSDIVIKERNDHSFLEISFNWSEFSV